MGADKCHSDQGLRLPERAVLTAILRNLHEGNAAFLQKSPKFSEPQLGAESPVFFSKPSVNILISARREPVNLQAEMATDPQMFGRLTAPKNSVIP
ncbi:hypothetical protein GCM10009799_33380 [Nocardiopsis rhodophaea]|uniref:Uncharacterized protein n=1 Tax=Nocardiopsis rhodophaea TaxID=280238 RepID=A0ABP5ENQ2_9ACTN